MVIKNKLKIGFILAYIILISSCEFNKDNETKVYEQKNFTFLGMNELTSDTVIKAEKIKFLKDSVVKIGNYHLSLEAELIEFENGSYIYSFEENEIADCEKSGLNSGNIYVNSKKVIGESTFNLVGQRPGKNGMGYELNLNNNKYYIPSDINLRSKYGYVRNKCKPSVPFSTKTLKSYWSKLVLDAGNTGNVYLNKNINLEEFYLNYVDDVAQADFIFTNHVGTNWGSWTENSPTGRDGKFGRICVSINKEYTNCETTNFKFKMLNKQNKEEYYGKQ